MDALRFRRIITDEFLLFLKSLFIGKCGILLKLIQLNTDFWHDKEFGIFALARD